MHTIDLLLLPCIGSPTSTPGLFYPSWWISRIIFFKRKV